MSEVQKTEHDFDGIEEFDNPLPGWWLAIFWVTIFIAIVYPIYYHVLYPDKLTWRKYDKDMAAIAEQKEAEPKADAAGAEDLMAMYKEGSWKESATADYKTNCAVCHREDGGGLIGPNFHDEFYIHGGTFESFIEVINEGVLAKGMTPFNGILKPDQVRGLAFHVYAFKGTPVENPKAAQGEKVDELGNFIEVAEEAEVPAEEAPEPSAPTQ